MAILELAKVKRQVLLRNVDVSPVDPPLHVAPKRFDCVGVNVAAHILFLTVIDGLMVEAMALD